MLDAIYVIPSFAEDLFFSILLLHFFLCSQKHFQEMVHFGENIYKIGMTRRLEPMDRVKELGDSSVPFPFDVHAIIKTSNAPALENALHKHFESRRLNLENGRKEFFRVSIDEIRSELEVLREELQIDSELRLTLLAEAKEFRLSEAKRKHLETSWQASN